MADEAIPELASRSSAQELPAVQRYGSVRLDAALVGVDWLHDSR
jgi:hypothetical protein